jgi:hypothetical protein
MFITADTQFECFAFGLDRISRLLEVGSAFTVLERGNEATGNAYYKLVAIVPHLASGDISEMPAMPVVAKDPTIRMPCRTFWARR